MSKPGFILFALALIVLGIYLFATAPPPLPASAGGGEMTGGASGAGSSADAVPVERMLETVAAENDAVRKLYTDDIVDQGMKVGLKFNESWRHEGEQAGPLPALLLRESAQNLQRSGVGLALFLGSDAPLVKANLFKGRQAEEFHQIRVSARPSYFEDNGTGQFTAMFPDYAQTMACVTCHNEHPNSPKRDWKLNDMMGATTWTYSKKTVSRAEFLKVLGATRQAFHDAYAAYLEKVKTFDPDKRPAVGDKWPRDGFFLPSVDVFTAEFERRASPNTVRELLAGAVLLKNG